jgi:hypothetical protein
MNKGNGHGKWKTYAGMEYYQENGTAYIGWFFIDCHSHGKIKRAIASIERKGKQVAAAGYIKEKDIEFLKEMGFIENTETSEFGKQQIWRKPWQVKNRQHEKNIKDIRES